MRMIPFILLCLLSISSRGQTLDILKGSTGHSAISEIRKAPNGDFFATGYYYISMDYDGQTYTSSGLDDVMLMRLDDAGQVQWLVSSGSPTGDDRASDMVVDKNAQRIYICGTAFEGATFDGVTNPYPFQSAFLAAYDYNGNQLWIEWLGEAGGEDAYDLSLDPSGNVYVTGVFEDTAVFGGTTLSAVQGASYIASLDANGNYRWAKKMESSGFVAELSVEAIDTDRLVIAGRYQGTISFVGGTYSNPNTFQNIFALSYDAVPDTVNWFTPVSSNESTVLTELGLDNAGQPMLLGYNNFGATTTIDGQTFTDVVTFLVRLNPQGQLYDLRPIGDGFFTARGMTVDGIGQTLITGSYAFQMEINGISLPTLNTNELLILRMQDNGTIDWYEVGEGPLNDIGTSLIVTDQGGIWLGGYFSTSLDMAGLSISAPGANNVNLFLAHFLEAGVVSSQQSLRVSPEVNIELFPNPTSGLIQISTFDNSEWKVAVWNAMGNPIMPVRQLMNNEIDLSALPAGLYFLELQNGKQSSTHRIIRQ